jgi:hypothetical protein
MKSTGYVVWFLDGFQYVSRVLKKAGLRKPRESADSKAESTS